MPRGASVDKAVALIRVTAGFKCGGVPTTVMG